MNQDKIFKINITGYLKSMFKKCLILPIVIGIFFSYSNSFSCTSIVASKEQQKQFLNHSLVGIIISKTPSLSTAVIKQGKTGEIKIYGYGDDISGFVVIHILKNKIILQNSEHSIQLFLENGFSSGISNELRIQEEKNEFSNSKESSSLNSEINSRPSSEFYISFNTTREIMNEWPHIQRETRFTPNFKNGKVRGFKITRLPQKNILSEIGLLENDVISEINGIAINGTTDLIQLMNKCRSSDQIKVEIEREDLVLSLIFVLR